MEEKKQESEILESTVAEPEMEAVETSEEVVVETQEDVEESAE